MPYFFQRETGSPVTQPLAEPRLRQIGPDQQSAQPPPVSGPEQFGAVVEPDAVARLEVIEQLLHGGTGFHHPVESGPVPQLIEVGEHQAVRARRNEVEQRRLRRHRGRGDADQQAERPAHPVGKRSHRHLSSAALPRSAASPASSAV